jgi:hypothetical protein
MSAKKSIRRKTTTRAGAMPPPKADADCAGCAALELRFQVALRVGYYLALHIESVQLREPVIEHITAAYVKRFGSSGGVPGKFDEFFDAYCEDVECDADPAMIRAGEQTVEYRRVWTNHAAVLAGRRALVRPRFGRAA